MVAGEAPVRVTVVTPFGSTAGGAEQWLLSALRNTDALRVRAVLLQDGPLRAELTAVGAEVTVAATGTDAAAIAVAAWGMLAEFRQHPPDVVVANGVKAQLVAALPAQLLRLPLVWVKHDHSYDSTLARPLGRLGTAVVATALEVGEPAGRSDLVVIEPERPPEPLPASAALGVLAGHGYQPDGRPAVVMIGRLVPYKGVDIGIRALAYEAASDWRLVVIGGDDAATPGETDRLRAIATSLAVADRVTFTGPIPAAGRLVGAFDALAVLTRPGQARSPQREGYGITATEAMLAGRPVVAAGEGPIARRLRASDPAAGIVVRPADPLATAHALGVLSDAGVRERMGAAGAVTARAQPDALEVSAALVDVLRRAAGGGGR